MVISEKLLYVYSAQLHSSTNNNRNVHRSQSYRDFLCGRRISQGFCRMLDKYSLNAPKMTGKRPYYRAGKLSVPEIMTIMILFHNSGYRCLKYFYLNEVCVNLRHLFPQVVSYNRFVELEKEAVIPLTIFIKKVLLGKSLVSVSLTPRLCVCARTSASISAQQKFPGAIGTHM